MALSAVQEETALFTWITAVSYWYLICLPLVVLVSTPFFLDQLFSTGVPRHQVNLNLLQVQRQILINKGK